MFIEGLIHVHAVLKKRKIVKRNTWSIVGPKLPCLPQIGSTLSVFLFGSKADEMDHFFKIADVNLVVEYDTDTNTNTCYYIIHTEQTQILTPECWEKFDTNISCYPEK